MLKNYLLITIRNLLKNKLFVFINIFGLSIALACAIVAYLNWEFNNDFDARYKNADKIYRINFVRITDGKPVKNGDCPMPLGNIVKLNFGEVEKVARVYPAGGNFKVGDELFRTEVTCVDPEFFSMFNFRMVSGNIDEIKDKSRIFISSELAKKYFAGIDDPVGQLITYINGDKRLEFIVGGVYEKPPLNSSFQSEAYVNFDNVLDVQDWSENDWSLFNSTFIMVNNPADVPAIEKKLQRYVEIQNRNKEDYKVDRYYLDPFRGMAVRAQKERIWNHWFNQSLPVSASYGPVTMAILLLLLACFNFTNTSIAIANKRVKEIGIRKVMGSGKRQLIFQFLGENILLSFVALLFGILIASILVPLYSSLWTFLDIHLSLIHNAGLIGFLLLLLILTGVLAGSYPAFYVSSFQPASVLKGSHKFSGTNYFTRILLTLQYAIAVVALIGGIIFAENAEYQKNYDMGFNLKTTVYAYISDPNTWQTYKNELSSYNRIESIAGSANEMTTSWYMDPVKYESTEMDANIMDIGDGYLQTIGATLLQGRDFIRDSQNDMKNSVIVNEELVSTFGWKEPIGKRIVVKDTTQLYVVGVVKNIFIDGGLWNPLRPLLLRYVPEKDYHFITVRTDPAQVKEVYDFMESKWKEVYPDVLPTVRYMDDNKAQSATINNNIKAVFIFLGITSLILSSIGLFSLVSLNVIKRTKEIGVRKVLGASIPRIIRNLSMEFMIILIIASVIGSAAGYFLTYTMIGSIWTYYMPMGVMPFILSVSVLLFLSAGTVGGRIFRAASVNPAYSLRNE